MLSLTDILDLSDTFHICMGLAFIEINTEIWIGFPSFIRGSRVLPQQKYPAMDSLTGWSLELFERSFYTAVRYTV